MARNTNRQGAGFELEIMHYLDGCQVWRWKEPCTLARHAGWNGYGYDSLRSSGSKGKIDVVSVPAAEQPLPGGGAWIRPMLFIQAKITAPRLSTPLSPEGRRILLDLAWRGQAAPLTASKAKDETTGRIRPHFRLLTGTGPREWEPWEPREDS